MIVEMDYFVSMDFAVLNNVTHGRNVSGLISAMNIIDARDALHLIVLLNALILVSAHKIGSIKVFAAHLGIVEGVLLIKTVWK